MRTYIKRFRAALAANDVKGAEEALKVAIPAIDRCAQKGMIPFKRASRFISRLSLAFNKINQD
jgi:ribosomal protein S20